MGQVNGFECGHSRGCVRFVFTQHIEQLCEPRSEQRFIAAYARTGQSSIPRLAPLEMDPRLSHSDHRACGRVGRTTSVPDCER